MSAIFNFQSLLVVIMLLIATCSYITSYASTFIGNRKEYGIWAFIWKGSRIGDRCSLWISISCLALSVKVLVS